MFDVRSEDVLGRSACEAIWMTRAALLAELEELKRTERAETLVMGRRARTANMLIFGMGILVVELEGRGVAKSLSVAGDEVCFPFRHVYCIRRWIVSSKCKYATVRANVMAGAVA